MTNLNNTDLSGCNCKVVSIATGNPAFADDISLITFTPFHLKEMINIIHKYCQELNVAINVSKSSVFVFILVFVTCLI